MLPGKKYTPEDFLWMAWSRKWLILIPTVLVAGAAFVYAQALPDLYRSSTLVQVIRQQVPEALVRPTVTDTVAERLRAISQQIVTRTKLERIIEEFDLYSAEREELPMEDVIERMRRDLGINIPTARRGQETSSFTVSFTADRPRTAMQVADRIAQLFVQENSAARELQAGSTSQFLQSALDDARRKLQEQDEKIAAFRQRNAGTLPTELQSNLQMIQTIQIQLQTNANEAMSAQDRLTELETTAAALMEPPVAASRGGETTPDAPVAQRLASAQAALRLMQLQLKDEHPEVRAAKRQIAELQAEAEAEALEVPIAPQTMTAAPARGVNSERVAAVRMQMQELKTRIEIQRQEDARLKKQLESYTARLNSTAGVEAELSDLMRDYGTLRATYEDLLRKSTNSQLAESLERRQIGEQFRVIEGARAPERPISPDRPRLYLMGLMAGLGLGVALAALLEYRDTGFKTDTDVLVSLSLPVLAVIPAMMNSDDKARHRKRVRLGVAAASAASVLLVGAVAAAWKLQLIQDWVR